MHHANDLNSQIHNHMLGNKNKTNHLQTYKPNRKTNTIEQSIVHCTTYTYYRIANNYNVDGKQKLKTIQCMKKEHIHTSILSLMQSPIENGKHDEEKLEKIQRKKEIK